MELTITKQIEQYATENETASENEIRKKFNVSRQLVSRIFHQIFTPEEIEKRRYDRLNLQAEEIEKALLENKTYSQISLELDINKSKLTRIIESNPVLTAIVVDNEKKETERIENIGEDWRANVPLATIMEKYGIGNTPTSAASYISKLRTLHGEEKFPKRLENQKSLEEKHRLYNEYVAQGMNRNEIYVLLGYKTLASMRASFTALPKEEEE